MCLTHALSTEEFCLQFSSFHSRSFEVTLISPSAYSTMVSFRLFIFPSPFIYYYRHRDRTSIVQCDPIGSTRANKMISSTGCRSPRSMHNGWKKRRRSWSPPMAVGTMSTWPSASVFLPTGLRRRMKCGARDGSTQPRSKADSSRARN